MPAVPAFPTLGKLSFNFLAATVARPRWLNRSQRREGLTKNFLGAAKLIVIHDPYFGPALNGGQLAGGNGKIIFSRHTLNSENGEDIPEMTHH